MTLRNDVQPKVEDEAPLLPTNGRVWSHSRRGSIHASRSKRRTVLATILFVGGGFFIPILAAAPVAFVYANASTYAVDRDTLHFKALPEPILLTFLVIGMIMSFVGFVATVLFKVMNRGYLPSALRNLAIVYALGAILAGTAYFYFMSGSAVTSYATQESTIQEWVEDALTVVTGDAVNDVEFTVDDKGYKDYLSGTADGPDSVTYQFTLEDKGDNEYELGDVLKTVVVK